ncbi:MAG: hypothetical protein WBD59_06865, partial [Candidatus Sulfotelmatobacter sp.]
MLDCELVDECTAGERGLDEDIREHSSGIELGCFAQLTPRLFDLFAAVVSEDLAHRRNVCAAPHIGDDERVT